MTSLSVLLVDDDPAAIELVAAALRPWADEIRVTRSAGEAMEVAAPVDVALVDIGVQQGAGMALVHFLKARDQHLAVVALTPAGDVEAEMVASALGVEATVAKPLTGDALLMALSPIRERRAARAAAAAVASAPPALAPPALDALLDAADLRGLASALAAAAAALTAAPVRVALEDARQGEVVARDGGEGAGEPDEALALAAHGEALGTLEVCRAAPGLARAGAREGLARIVRAAAAVGVLLRRVDAIARVGIKDPDTSAYTFSYFVDVAGREIERARRHDRRFVLLTFAIDGYAALAAQAGADAVREARRELVDTILEAVRDSDVLAHVEDDELYLLVPESGLLGGLVCRRRIAERHARRTGLARLEGRVALDVTIGLAAFPRDGSELTALLKAAHRRAGAARDGVVRLLREQRGGVAAALGALLRYRPDEAVWQLRQAALPGEAVAAIAAAVTREATRGPAAREGMLYIVGDRGHPLVRGAAEAARLGGGGVPAYWLRPAAPDGRSETSSQGVRVSPVEIEIDGQQVGPFALLVALTDAWAYACVVSGHGEYKRVAHSCDLEVADALMAELQATFHLQRGAE